MIIHWSLSDSKSPQVSRTLLSILAVLNNAVVWMVSTLLPTSNSSSPFNNPLVTVPKAPITFSIIVTFMLLSFFNSLARSRYLSFFSHSLISRDSKVDSRFFIQRSLSLESELQITLYPQDSSEYSSRSQQYCSLDGLDSVSDFKFL